MGIYVDKVHIYCDQCEDNVMIESEELGSIDFGRQINHNEWNSLADVVGGIAFEKGWYINPLNLVSCPSCDNGTDGLD